MKFFLEWFEICRSIAQFIIKKVKPLTYQIWRSATTLANPSIMVLFDHSPKTSEGYIFSMKESDCIVSGQLDNPSSSVHSYLSDNNDKSDLQKKNFEVQDVIVAKTSPTKVYT